MEAENPKHKSAKLFALFNPILSFFKPRRRRTRFMDLPRVIMVEILSKLPIESMLSSRKVCKLWYNLFSDPLFLTMYKSRLPPPCILFSRDHDISQLLELELPCDDSSTNIYDINTLVYISNPLLGEYFKLKLPELEKSVCRVVYGFCFSEVSGKYKLVRSVTRRFTGHREVSELEVYTLGVDGKWRNLGQVPYPVWQDFGQVCVNGALHWMDPVDKDNIYSFDIETEKLKSVPGPPGLVFPFKYLAQAESQRSTCAPSCVTLVELGNCLCLTDDSGSIYGHIDIWWMKEYGIAESWTKVRILTCLGPAGFGLDICFQKYLPILIWKDGEILMQGKKGSQLLSYNPKDMTFTMIPISRGIRTVATRYLPSFYSLKTLAGGQLSSLKCLSD
ncbi:hypothetical protein T459_29230 [Capsicum annuum]|uniref:F-box domain-containing protein n=1 Tax=Capsicum annuum TaxID=4072 RepID=A0A2G2Y4Y4_CAPAN|nr:hypothetical protein T459_29230 [Capsicum annuum]